MMNKRQPRRPPFSQRKRPATTEIRILEDGRIMANNLTPMMAEALSKLNPEEPDFARRLKTGR